MNRFYITILSSIKKAVSATEGPHADDYSKDLPAYWAEQRNHPLNEKELPSKILELVRNCRMKTRKVVNEGRLAQCASD